MPPTNTTLPEFVEVFRANFGDVKRLLEIHNELGGDGPGRRHNLEVVHKSAVVLLVACWEAFIEDMATAGFSFLLENANDHKAFPDTVLIQAIKPLREKKDDREIWKIADTGWKSVLEVHREQILKSHVGKLNTPKPDQIDSLYNKLLGISKISNSWKWSGMSSEHARDKLVKLVELRGSIAHRVGTSEPVRKAVVDDYIMFLRELCVMTSNDCRSHLLERTGKSPWSSYRRPDR